MKKAILLFLITLSYSSSSYGILELCPTISETGRDGCIKVEQVLIFGEWYTASHSNIELPTGYSFDSEDSDIRHHSGNANQGIPKLTRKNAWVLFTAGYRTWTLVNGKIEKYSRRDKFDMETIRTYLPFARLMFLKNPKLDMISLAHSDEISIIIQKPDNEDDLNDEIIFPTPPDPKEIEKSLYEMDKTFLRVLPNPGTDVIRVFFENKTPVSAIAIHTENGQLVKTSEYNTAKQEVRISIKDLKPGFYLVKIRDKHGRDFVNKLKKE